MKPSRPLVEALGLTLVVLLAIRAVVALGSGVLWDLPLALAPVLFMWAPVAFMRWQGRDPDVFPLALPSGPEERHLWVQGAGWAALFAAVMLPPFVAGYHAWQTWIFPEILGELCARRVPGTCAEAFRAATFAPAWRLPERWWELVPYHLLFVAIPEELFYRGWMQSRLDEAWAPRWKVWGATVGPSLFVTSLIFAVGHSVVTFQWWHLFIVVPSLAFGWLRARTGHVVAGAFFHAFCNVLVAFLDAAWGVRVGV